MDDPPTSDAAARASEREAMMRRVDELLVETARETGVARLAPGVRAAMLAVPRHAFVPDDVSDRAYVDAALPIGCHRTISQPFIVALMTELAAAGPDSVVLEIGTGSGYQAAVLAELAQHVYTIEIVPELARRSAAVLAELGYANVEVCHGDGFGGWEEHAPFDVILVTAAGPEPPAPLVRQLRPGGRMVLPVGPRSQLQELLLLRKSEAGAIETERVLPVAFIPLVRESGEAGGP
ncbi:MAG: protein-L-isoaspartate(D-aspartate) O-methyltransferase [Proteobacteria bacterium]|nr:protein-L-isoaspartate(D-aspartate) O-methyltransferase [Pseudomonadota bacterium]